MIDYVAVFTNTNSLAFPDTLTVNASGPSATDGTELVKLFGDDLWGARQAVMDYAGLIPDGVSEAPGTSQLVEALQLGFGGSPGFVQEWNLASIPAVTGHRCLFLQGQGIQHVNYPDLLDAVYVGDANNAAVAAGGGSYYKAEFSTGTNPDITGDFLILPDRRGVVGRGLDAAASIDPDGASRFLGDLQIDAGQGHWHNIQSAFGTDNLFNTDKATGSTVNGQGGIGNGSVQDDPAVETTGAVADGVNGTPRIDTETRMYNASTHFVIWY